jgi:hypothetical protein
MSQTGRTPYLFYRKTVLVFLLSIRIRVESNVKLINNDSKVKVRQIVARL